jgi:hypothetical protein
MKRRGGAAVDPATALLDDEQQDAIVKELHAAVEAQNRFWRSAALTLAAAVAMAYLAGAVTSMMRPQVVCPHMDSCRGIGYRGVAAALLAGCLSVVLLGMCCRHRLPHSLSLTDPPHLHTRSH